MPHCPVCGLEPIGRRSRCPIDNAFLQTLRCPGCEGEVGWKDSFCGWCGQALTKDTGPHRDVVALERCSPLPAALSYAVDGILVLALAPVLFSFILEDGITGNLGSLPICLPFLWF